MSLFCKSWHKVSEARDYKTSLSSSPHTAFFLGSWNSCNFLSWLTWNWWEAF